MHFHALNRKTNTNSKLIIYDSIELVNSEHWNLVANGSTIYLSLAYLSAIDKAIHEDIKFRYVIFYNHLLKPVAIAYFQLIHFVDKGIKYRDVLCKIGDKIKNKLLESIDARVLLCGNIFACGENGFAHTSDINPMEAYHQVAESMKRITLEEQKNVQICFSMLKEFWPSSFENADTLKKSSYRELMFDVNMVMKIQPHWKTMDDYLLDMTTKFRTKAKGVYKKSNTIKIKYFEFNDVVKYKNRIEELYHLVLSKAAYKFGELNGQAFVNLKQNLKEKFIFQGYFLEATLVGFSAAFHFNTIIDANFVGIDYKYNQDYAIYQRMLYDFVELSIKLGANELRLGRTAELIKSSIGAEPVNMKLYIKHRNSFSNKLIIPFVKAISPSEFELRYPFKTEINTQTQTN
jgi:hypothetical protein